MIAGGLEVSAPALAVRGAGMSALGIGGGLEEVVDFRNREIAQFRRPEATQVRLRCIKR